MEQMTEPQGKTHSTRALVELRKKILSGDLSGGTRLFEVPLAEELEISRTPIREAMSRLAEEGLLDRVKSGGFVVRTFRFADVIDAIELRGVLEGTAARLAAERGPDPEIVAQMREIVDQLDGCLLETPDGVNLEAYSELNENFHTALANASGSGVLKRELDRVSRLPFAAPSAFSPDRADIGAFRRSLNIAQDQHHEIVSAIVAREGARAEAIAREHARIARRNLDYVLREDRSLIDQVPSLALVSE